MALVSWFITGMFWRQQVPFLVKLPVAVVLTVIFMVTLGTLLALLISIPIIPNGNLMGALIYEFTSTFSLFAQMGLETGALWLPVVIIRIVFLTVRSRRQAHQK